MDHDTISYLRATSPAWRLLRADTAPLALSVLGRIFIVENVRTIAETDLVSRVDDLLYAANATFPSEEGRDAYPRSARDYVDGWADPKQGWLRKFYPDGSMEAHYDATLDVERAYRFVTGLQGRTFVGTESRLQTIVELLRVIVAGAEGDPDAQLDQLRRRRDEIDAEIAKLAAGEAGPMDPVALLDRYQHFASTARELLSDFRAVEDNFRGLDRSIRADIAAWEGSKGELLDQIVGDRHAIADSDQGRSFQAFHDFLLSRGRRDELTELLQRLVELDTIEVDRSLGRIHFDWLAAAERTQQTVRQLSEQLRRFLDDKVWLENRRVVELLRSVERSALALRDTRSPELTMEIDASSPDVLLPFERPLYAPPTFTGVDSALTSPDDECLDLDSLFDQVYVDTARLTATVRSALRHQDQVALDTLLADHPPTQGIAELVGYLGLAEDDFDVVIDEHETLDVALADSEGRMRLVCLPRVLLVRRRRSVMGRSGA
jgi:hypothetical protein